MHPEKQFQSKYAGSSAHGKSNHLATQRDNQMTISSMENHMEIGEAAGISRDDGLDNDKPVIAVVPAHLQPHWEAWGFQILVLDTIR